MVCFHQYSVVVLTLMILQESNGQNATDGVGNSTEENDTTYRPTVTSSVEPASVSLTTAIQTELTSPYEGGCEYCLAVLRNLVDEAATGNETKQNIGQNCLNFAEGKNDLVSCINNSMVNCRDNGTIFEEVLRDFKDICITDCPTYETIRDGLGLCWQNYTVIRELQKLGKFTHFCRLWVDHTACVQSTIEGCGAAMSSLAIDEYIALYDDQQSYNQLKLNSEYVCNKACDGLDEIFQNASNCIQFITKQIGREDNQQGEPLQCRAVLSCTFETKTDGACPKAEKLVSDVYPKYADIVIPYLNRCVQFGIIHVYTVITNVTKQASLEGIELATILNHFTEQPSNETSTPFVNKTAMVIEQVTTENTTTYTSSVTTWKTSSMLLEGTNSTTMTSETTSPTYPGRTSIPHNPRKPPIKSAGRTAKVWIPCSKKEKIAAIAESTSQTMELRANHVTTGLTVTLLTVILYSS